MVIRVLYTYKYAGYNNTAVGATPNYAYIMLQYNDVDYSCR